MLASTAQPFQMVVYPNRQRAMVISTEEMEQARAISNTNGAPDTYFCKGLEFIFATPFFVFGLLTHLLHSDSKANAT